MRKRYGYLKVMTSKQAKLHYAGAFTSVNETDNSTVTYKLKQLRAGINFQDRHIINVSRQGSVKWVISRICDHASGTLQPCKNRSFAECPLHDWKLDLNTLRYTNVNVSKKTLAFEVDNGLITIHQAEKHLKLADTLFDNQKPGQLKIKFLAHASLLFKCGEISIVTDPWLKGPCFLNGWWHQPAPSDDAIQQLLDADLVYISHNHSDHMHAETLRLLLAQRPDMPIIVPNFKSKSTWRPLTKMGFSNIIALDFNQIHQIDSQQIYLSILKSGDFRDDSGLYLSYGQKQALITVDASVLNHLVLPAPIDFLATSFAAGASGYPWCFDHYDENTRQMIADKRRLSVKNSILKYIKACQPKVYMPYAGYFSESARRDKYIKNNNIKNSVDDIKKLIDEYYPDIVYYDPGQYEQISLGQDIKMSAANTNRTEEISPHVIDAYLQKETMPDLTALIDQASEYFSACDFKDQLYLYLIPCHDDFSPLSKGLIINFDGDTDISCDNSAAIISHYEKQPEHCRHLCIKVRAAQLWQVIKYYQSWEQLSIGFHCRIKRKPDIYNSDFWYHFSNIYIQ